MSGYSSLKTEVWGSEQKGKGELLLDKREHPAIQGCFATLAMSRVCLSLCGRNLRCLGTRQLQGERGNELPHKILQRESVFVEFAEEARFSASVRPLKRAALRPKPLSRSTTSAQRDLSDGSLPGSSRTRNQNTIRHLRGCGGVTLAGAPGPARALIRPRARAYQARRARLSGPARALIRPGAGAARAPPIRGDGRAPRRAAPANGKLLLREDNISRAVRRDTTRAGYD
ncbi:hypothetical protein NDU88_003842 [Pleurodeles waltl]|uniref:Uncharacterized protein n=1 Tax=Pleurodeles waltl TaxID=8319 RepID=A0AAV7UZL4_PLEWA|nr:hypothetical protein NDU88_003842 [Pleurodeles waltl]